MITPVGLPKNYRRLSQHSGQAIVLILLLTLAGLVGGVALYSTGILTSEKIQLQNAADASAYSVSVIEARDLNYTAYMNRAMVANEVAIGQMVSMMSWAYMTRSTPEFISNYAGLLDAIICPISLGSSCSSASSAVKPIVTPLRTISTAVFKVVDSFTKPVAKGLSILNKMYSLSQQGFHILSFIFSASTLFDIKDKNIDDAEFSPFGAVALARHFTSYYADLLTDSLYGFVNGYAPGNPGDAAGVNRLAQVVNDSRDGFTQNRKCDLDTTEGLDIPAVTTPKLDLGIASFGPIIVKFATPGVTCYPTPVAPDNDGGWLATLFGVNIKFEASFDVLLVATSLKAEVYFNAGISRQGGTDLRQGTDNNYTWSGADTTAPDILVGADFEICASVLGIEECVYPSINVNPPLPPFGVGAALAGQPSPNTSDIPYGDEPRDVMYGRASKNVLAWDFVIPPIPNPAAGWIPTAAAFKHMKSVKQQLSASDRQINASYNLRRYQDTEDRPEITTSVDSGDWISGLEAPYLLIGLIKDDAVQNSQVLASGRFELDAPRNGLLGSTVPLGVIAKSEVYYTRPSDLDYFKRSDGREEKSNAFNPYWQARLVDTSYIDRVAALAFQHGQIPLPAAAFTIISQAQSLLAKLI